MSASDSRSWDDRSIGGSAVDDAYLVSQTSLIEACKSGRQMGSRVSEPSFRGRIKNLLQRRPVNVPSCSNL